ncbi:hypothetical protein Emed_006051 [Eimeria media]
MSHSTRDPSLDSSVSHRGSRETGRASVMPRINEELDEPEAFNLDNDSIEDMTVDGPVATLDPRRLIILTRAPEFDGQKPRGWVRNMEQYFARYNITNEEKVFVMSYALKGDAFDRWSLLGERGTQPETWEAIKEDFLQNFITATSASTVYELQRLVYKGDIRKFSNQFAAILAKGEPLDPRDELEIYLTALPGAVARIASEKEPKCWDEARNILIRASAKEQRLA